MKYPKITFTITTSRRWDLFYRTMESFIASCRDMDLITRWIISDDSSDSKDLEAAQAKYPMFEVFRSEKPGQPANVNTCFSKVGSEWFFHCEDDWLFTKKDYFIRKMFDIAFDDERIRNITLRGWEGTYVRHGKVEYILHNCIRPCGLEMQAYCDGSWWGYSLNPGLQHLPTVKKLGTYPDDYSEDNQEWDRPQAQLYLKMGLRRANLVGKYMEHLGEERGVREVFK